MSTSPKRLAALASAALVAAGMTVLAPPAAQANPDGSDLVISEVYGAGGNSGAVYNADFVELYNPTDDPIDLLGSYVAYRSATGGLGGSVALRGTLDAGDHYLVQMSAAGGTGGALTPDRIASPAISMAAAGGQVLLTEGFGPFTQLGDLAGADGIIDMVGLDPTAAGANSFEGAAGPAATATLSANRAADGEDSDDNSADFTLAAPTPEFCGCVPAAAPFTGSIAQIQGTGDTSPHLDATVTTTGVVTARYPAGGFNGFFMQTDGTGGAVDATPGAADGIFVFLGAANAASAPALGAKVTVTGPASEFAGMTQISPASPADVVPAGTATGVTAWSAAYPTTNAAREAHEGELLAPTNTFTVTNTFATNTFAEIGLATGTTPLLQPTDVAAPGPDADAVAADNAARGVVLDDGSSSNYTTNASGTAAPWLNNATAGFNPVRVGARATFPAVTSASTSDGVILDFRNNVWKFQPQAQVTNNGSGVATFVNTRTNQPRGVGGDLKLATFNVLNYFNTTGEAWNATHPGDCSFFNDRQGNPITVNDCTSDNGPRGAANDANLARQQIKIVRAINAMDADIVGLEEIENSVALGEDRDDALSALVAALNSDAGFERWKFAPSPAAADLPDVADQDVIRTAFIFNPDTVTRVGQSEVLSDSPAFANAREPLAQAFKSEGASDDEAFVVVANHFKSKSDSSPPQRGNDNEDVFDGQGAFNGDRTRQAEALVDFANDFATDHGTTRIFLAGDFNSYTFEDPMQVLYDAGFINIPTDVPGETTYSFSGLSGSLDHILASPDAFADVTGADIWNINSGESIAFEYSRFNNNVTNFHQANVYRSSDHDPEIVGIERPGNNIEKVQILGTNDFHGRINRNPTGAEAGASVMAGAVQHFENINPDTVFAAAGDLIGASTFESFILNDKPTIDALNAAGLDVSSVGNHEFDQGYDDLVNRVMAPYDIDDNPEGGAEWKYLGANVRMKTTHDPALEESWIKDFGDIEVGFVGAVTEHLPELVSPEGIADIEVTDIVEATNREADELKDAGADIVILLVHEGAATTALSSATDPASDFGKIVNGVNANVDAIISGHTHLAYNHRISVPAWKAQDRTVTRRPVVSSGQYGYNLNRLNFRFNTDTGELVGISQSIVPLQNGDATWTANFPEVPEVTQIVSAANAKADVLGAQVLGKLGGAFNRAKLSNGTTENRGGESTLGNLVAEVQRWATESPTTGSAQIAFMNPGGLRADMVPAPDGSLTFRSAANVQPFANTLVNMDLTGAQIKAALEQQWQPAGAARPFLRLGASEGFTYTYDPALPAGSRITGMWLDGVPISTGATYSVTVNSFLAAGGDNFGAFAGGTGKQDTGQTDLQAMVDYMAAFGSPGPLAVDYSQRAVGVKLPASAPASYAPGAHVTFDLTSLAMSTAADTKDTSVTVSLNGTSLGSFPVANVIGTDIFDEYGTASVDVVVPAGTPGGPAVLQVAGAATGTVVRVPITVSGGTQPPAPVNTTVSGSAKSFAYGKTGSLAITVSPATAAGTVTVTTDKGVTVGTATITGGKGSLALAAKGLKPGTHTLTLAYAGNSTHKASTGTVSVQVTKPEPKVKVKRDKTVEKGDKSKVVVKVTAPDDIEVGGKVKLVIMGTGKSFTAKVVDGKAVFELPAYAKTGTYTLQVKYLGTKLLDSVTKKVNVTVVK
jgi:5'-nucleotidase